jgi:hypothetical protein
LNGHRQTWVWLGIWTSTKPSGGFIYTHGQKHKWLTGLHKHGLLGNHQPLLPRKYECCANPLIVAQGSIWIVKNGLNKQGLALFIQGGSYKTDSASGHRPLWIWAAQNHLQPWHYPIG